MHGSAMPTNFSFSTFVSVYSCDVSSYALRWKSVFICGLSHAPWDGDGDTAEKNGEKIYYKLKLFSFRCWKNMETHLELHLATEYTQQIHTNKTQTGTGSVTTYYIIWSGF